jgi:hypothetical protein
MEHLRKPDRESPLYKQAAAIVAAAKNGDIVKVGKKHYLVATVIEKNGGIVFEDAPPFSVNDVMLKLGNELYALMPRTAFVYEVYGKPKTRVMPKQNPVPCIECANKELLIIRLRHRLRLNGGGSSDA